MLICLLVFIEAKTLQLIGYHILLSSNIKGKLMSIKKNVVHLWFQHFSAR